MWYREAATPKQVELDPKVKDRFTDFNFNRGKPLPVYYSPQNKALYLGEIMWRALDLPTDADGIFAHPQTVADFLRYADDMARLAPQLNDPKETALAKLLQQMASAVRGASTSHEKEGLPLVRMQPVHEDDLDNELRSQHLGNLERNLAHETVHYDQSIAGDGDIDRHLPEGVQDQYGSTYGNLLRNLNRNYLEDPSSGYDLDPKTVTREIPAFLGTGDQNATNMGSDNRTGFGYQLGAMRERDALLNYVLRLMEEHGPDVALGMFVNKRAPRDVIQEAARRYKEFRSTNNRSPKRDDLTWVNSEESWFSESKRRRDDMTDEERARLRKSRGLAV